MRERWSYVVLAAFITLLFLLLGVGGFKYVQENNRAWCELVHASLPTSAPVRPVAPVHPTPVAEKTYSAAMKYYNDYQIVVRLGHRLGCL